MYILENNHTHIKLNKLTPLTWPLEGSENLIKSPDFISPAGVFKRQFNVPTVATEPRPLGFQ